MSILVTGAYGQLGRELCQQIGPDARPTDYDTLDLCDGPAVLAALARWRPRAVVNCAAYTQVDLAEKEPAVVEMLRQRMEAWIAKREAETGLPDPIMNQGDWHGHAGVGAFKTSQQAYDTLHIGDPAQAARLQAKSRD